MAQEYHRIVISYWLSRVSKQKPSYRNDFKKTHAHLISCHRTGEVCSPQFFTWNCFRSFEWSQLVTVWICVHWWPPVLIRTNAWNETIGALRLMCDVNNLHALHRLNYIVQNQTISGCIRDSNDGSVWQNRSKQRKHTMSNYKSA